MLIIRVAGGGAAAPAIGSTSQANDWLIVNPPPGTPNFPATAGRRQHGRDRRAAVLVALDSPAAANDGRPRIGVQLGQRGDFFGRDSRDFRRPLEGPFLAALAELLPIAGVVPRKSRSARPEANSQRMIAKATGKSAPGRSGQMQIGLPRERRAARIDDDQLRPVCPALGG